MIGPNIVFELQTWKEGDEAERLAFNSRGPGRSMDI